MANFYDAFKGRMSNMAGSQFSSAGRGSATFLARQSEETAKALNELSDGALRYFIERVGKLNTTSKQASVAVENLIDETKDKFQLDNKVLSQLKQLTKQQLDHFYITQKSMNQDSVYYKNQVERLEQRKRIYQAEAQIQRDALDSIQKNFWGPMTGILKNSQLLDLTKNITKAFSSASQSVVKESYNLSKTVNQTILSSWGNQMGAVISKAAQNYASEVGKSLMDGVKGFGQGFRQGKDRYFEIEKQKTIAKEERLTYKLENSINKFSNVITILDNKWSLMVRNFDSASRNFNEYVNHARHTSGIGSGASMPPNIGSGVNRFLNNENITGVAQRASSFASGIFSGITSLIPIAGNLLGSSIREVQEIVSLAANTLVDIAKERDQFRVDMLKQFGNLGRHWEQFVYGEFEKHLAQTGILLEGWQKNFFAIASEYGDINNLSQKQITYQTEVTEAMGLSVDESAKLFHQMDNLGIANEKHFEKFRLQVTRFATIDGVGSKDIMKDIAKNTEYIAMVGSPKMIEGFAKSAGELRSMGLHIDTMLKAMDQFQDFQSAAENTFKLNAALGTNLNPVRMHIMAMMGDVQGIQKAIFDNLSDVQNLNTIQIRTISQTLGMSAEEVRNMHESLRIKKEMGNATISLAQLQSKEIDQTKTLTMFQRLGLKTDQDRQDYLFNRTAELYRQHKLDFDNFSDFKKALYGGGETGKGLKQELSVMLQRGEEPQTVQDVLKEQIGIATNNLIAQLTVAQSMDKSIANINTLQIELNKIMLHLLVWGLNAVTPMLQGMLNFMGMHETAKLAGNVSQDIRNVLNDPNIMKILDPNANLAKYGLYNNREGAILEKEWQQVQNPSYWSGLMSKLPNVIFEGVKMALGWLMEHPTFAAIAAGLMAMRVAGPAMGVVNTLHNFGLLKGAGGIGNVGNIFGKWGSVGGLGKGIGIGGTALMAGAQVLQDMNASTAKEKREAWGGSAGMIAGGGIGAFFGGPMGMMIGAGIGKYAGEAISGFFKSGTEKYQDEMDEKNKQLQNIFAGNDAVLNASQPLIDGKKQELLLAQDGINQTKDLIKSKAAEKDIITQLNSTLNSLKENGVNGIDELIKKLQDPKINFKTINQVIEDVSTKISNSLDSISGFEKETAKMSLLNQMLSLSQARQTSFSNKYSDILGDTGNMTHEQTTRVSSDPDFINWFNGNRGFHMQQWKTMGDQAVYHDFLSGQNIDLQLQQKQLQQSVNDEYGKVLPMTRNIVGQANGGLITGSGGPREDKVPAMLSNGEFVIPSHIVNAYGVPFFNNLIGHYADGGMINPAFLPMSYRNNPALSLGHAMPASSTSVQHPFRQMAHNNYRNWAIKHGWNSGREQSYKPHGFSFRENIRNGMDNLRGMENGVRAGSANMLIKPLRLLSELQSLPYNYLGAGQMNPMGGINNFIKNVGDSNDASVQDKPQGFQMNHAMQFLPEIGGMIAGNAAMAESSGGSTLPHILHAAHGTHENVHAAEMLTELISQIGANGVLHQLGNRLGSIVAQLSSLSTSTDVMLDGEKIGRSVVKLLYSQMKK